jgi:hypothetical protein
MSRITHFEIPTENPEVSMAFYNNVFNWTFQQFGQNNYWLATTGSSDEPGINGAIMKKRDPKQPMTNSISVENIDAVIIAIEENGGKIVVPKTAVSNIGYMAFFTDPDQNILGLWQDNHEAK